MSEIQGWRKRALGARLMARDWLESKRWLKSKGQRWSAPTTWRLALPASFLASAAFVSYSSERSALGAGWLGAIFCLGLIAAQMKWIWAEVKIARAQSEQLKRRWLEAQLRLRWTEAPLGHWLDRASLEDGYGAFKAFAFTMLWMCALMLAAVSAWNAALDPGLAWPGGGEGAWTLWAFAKTQQLGLWLCAGAFAGRWGVWVAQAGWELAQVQVRRIKRIAERWDARFSARVDAYMASEQRALDERRALGQASRPSLLAKAKGALSAEDPELLSKRPRL